MSEEELININGIREDLYQAMLIGDITLNSKHSQELYNFMNYQDKEIEKLKEEKESWKRVATKNFNEAEDYKSIIKEVREYTNKYFVLGGNTYKEKVLEILDKENI